MKPRIIYDSSCPVCINYLRLLKKTVGEDEMEYFGSGGGGEDFKYINKLGKVYAGKPAIEAMSVDFPKITNLMPLLPANYRVAGLKVAYSAGSIVRKAINKVRGGGCRSCGH